METNSRYFVICLFTPLLALGCALKVNLPQATFRCSSAIECPEEWICRVNQDDAMEPPTGTEGFCYLPPEGPFAIGGIVNGIPDNDSITLQLNDDKEALTLTENDNFEFTKPIGKNEGFQVTVGVPPADHACTVTGGTGVATARVTDVNILCLPDCNGVVTGSSICESYFKASNAGMGDKFGWSVALSKDGNTLAVGARDEDGSSLSTLANPNDDVPVSGVVYIFSKQSDATWLQEAYLKATNVGNGDKFGSSISLSEDGQVLAIGACDEDGDANSTDTAPNNDALDAGAAYVFVRQSDGGWLQTAYLKAENAEEYDRFGGSVSISSDGMVIVVGAYQGGVSGMPLGGVYIYARQSDGTWAQEAMLTVSGSTNFARSVAISQDGTWLAVGDEGEDRAYVFERQSPGSWTLDATFVHTPFGSSDDFGQSISISADGQLVVVGAPEAINGGQVFAYARQSDGTWSLNMLLGAGPSTQTAFGHSVSLSTDGKFLAVGDPFEGLGGAAHFFEQENNGVWALRKSLKASNAQIEDEFGLSVAVTHNAGKVSLAVGAWLEDGDANSTLDAPNEDAEDSGAVYVFE